MSPTYRFQTSGFGALWFKMSLSTLAMKILAKATAIFVPSSVDHVNIFLIFCNACFSQFGHGIALFTVSFSYLHYNEI